MSDTRQPFRLTVRCGEQLRERITVQARTPHQAARVGRQLRRALQRIDRVPATRRGEYDLRVEALGHA